MNMVAALLWSIRLGTHSGLTFVIVINQGHIAVNILKLALISYKNVITFSLLSFNNLSVNVTANVFFLYELYL